jgi:hypothetical protein
MIMNARVLGDKITHSMRNQSLLNNTLVKFQLNLEFNISHVTDGRLMACLRRRISHEYFSERNA